MRITADVTRGRTVRIVVDGQDVDSHDGESIAAALMAAGLRTTRWTERARETRGYFCGMGICHDCLVTVDGVPNVRACVTAVRDGLHVERQHGDGPGTARGGL